MMMMIIEPHDDSSVSVCIGGEGVDNLLKMAGVFIVKSRFTRSRTLYNELDLQQRHRLARDLKSNGISVI